MKKTVLVLLLGLIALAPLAQATTMQIEAPSLEEQLQPLGRGEAIPEGQIATNSADYFGGIFLGYVPSMPACAYLASSFGYWSWYTLISPFGVISCFGR